MSTNMNNTPTFIYKEFKKRGVPVEVIDEEHGLMRYFHDDDWHMLRSCVTDKTSATSSYVCNTKTLADIVARAVDMTIPTSTRFESLEQAIDFMKQHNSIVVKPLDSAHGHGVATGIKTKTDLKKALVEVKKFSKRPAILQKMVTGLDVRILVIGGKYAAAVRRVPPKVVGDGVRTVEELINDLNKEPERAAAVGMRGTLGRINLNFAKNFLKRRLHAVPQKGEEVTVLGVSNTSLGGHAEDITDDLSPEIYQKAEAFARKLNMPVCGIDIMLNEDGSYHFIEGNACPGFGPHHHPRVGKPRDVTKLFVDMLLEA